MAEAEVVECPLCGTPDTKHLYQGDGFAMGRCPGCGLVRQNPRLTETALLAGLYDGLTQAWAPLIHRPQRYEGLESWESKPRSAYRQSVDAVDHVRAAMAARGIWIDVGASTGGLLLAARDAGWKVAGIEPGTRQVEICRSLHGMEMVHGVLADASWPDGYAEVVSYRHVLEHVHDPLAELAEVRRLLAPDGLLLVEVPNYAGPRYRWGRLRSSLRLCRPFWERVNVPEHLYYFTARTLGALLRKSGYEPVYCRTYGRVRPEAGPVRTAYDRARDVVGLGNKLRVVARKAEETPEASRPQGP